MDIFEKWAKKSFIAGFVGLLTVGIMPACGAISIAYALAAKKSKKELSNKAQNQIKQGIIMSVVSFFLFIADFVFLYILLK